MESALLELMDKGRPDDVVPVIIRLHPGQPIPPGLRPVASFGLIHTVRVIRDEIARLRELVASMKTVQFYTPAPWGDEEDWEESEADDLAVRPTDQRRQSGFPSGRGVLLCHLDWGLDFAHPAFREADGSTRLVALWDQAARYDPAVSNVYGFGRIYTREEINRALFSPDPHATLGYRWWSSDRGNGSHGTHTLGIAGGSGLPQLPAGYAPDAELLFVDLSTRTPSGPQPLGSSTDLLEGVHFADSIAGDRSLVINASLGRQAGQHDGLTLTEQALDWFVTRRTGRAMTMSCGNYYNKRAHAQLMITPGDTRTLAMELAPGNRKSELDLWYPRSDRLRVSCHGPGGIAAGPLEPDTRGELISGGRPVGRLYHRSDDPNNGDHQVSLFLDGTAPAGDYTVVLEGAVIGDGRVHAWVERDPAGTARLRFGLDDDDPRVTVGTICNGFATTAVAAYDAHDPNRPPGSFSSSSPTRDGRTSRPCVAAPGVKVLSARSAQRSGDANFVSSRMSGTSMAAPGVAGTIAMLFECAPHQLSSDEIHALLAETADSIPESQRERLGVGYLNPAAAVAACRMLPPRVPAAVPRPAPLSPRPQVRVPALQESDMSTHEYDQQDGDAFDCDADSELEGADTAGEAELENADEELTATMEGEEAEAFNPSSEDDDADAIRDHRRRSGGGGGWAMPFQIQLPVGGSGGLGIGIPIGGRNSPFALSVPLGGTQPPAPTAAPVTPAPAQAAGPLATAPANPTPPGAEPPLVTALDLPPDPVVAATEFAAELGELGGNDDAATEAEEAAAAEADAAMLEEAGRIAALQQHYFRPDIAEADARYAGEQLVAAAETLSAMPDSSDGLCRMLSEQVGDGSTETSEVELPLFELFTRARRGERTLPSLLGRPARVLAAPGATLDGIAPRRGDVMLRVFPGHRFVQLSIVASPDLVSLDRMPERGWRSEGSGVPLPGRYLQVVEPWPVRRVEADRFARRLANAADIVPLDTVLMRLLTESEQHAPGPEAEEDHAHPVVAVGARGPEVAALQRRLNEFDQRRQAARLPSLGNMPLAEDGSFGPRLRAAVLALQRLAPPGMVPEPNGTMDQATWTALAFLEGSLGLLSPNPPAHPQRPSQGRARPTGSAVPPGQETIAQVPLLSAHRGTPPDLMLRWNAMPAGTQQVDAVVHLHGFSGHGEAMRIDRDKLPNSGLDFFNPANPAESGRNVPTLGILPRGNYYGGRTHMGYDFSALFAPGALTSLIRLALERFAAATGLRDVRPGRLILTGHSGGGAAIMRLLADNDPDEVHCFDALYNSPAPLIRWVQERLQSGRGATSALRVLFRDGEGTARNSHAVADALRTALRGDAAHTRQFRVEPVPVPHNDIPRRFGWQLLADASADLDIARARRAQPPPADGKEGWAATDYETDPVSPGLSQDEVDRLGRCTLGNSSDLERYFDSAGSFAGWFNRELSGRGPFTRGRGGALRVPTGDAARERFRRFWDRLDLAYGQPQISLLEFASLMAIVLNETDGDFAGRTESSGRGGGGRRDANGEHRGLAYFFDRILLRPGHHKASYNRLSGGRTAGSLFNDPVFTRAHGSLGGADRLAHRGDDYGGAWNGETYPATDFPVDEAVTETAFIREADFYKFRGRGIIQTTGRASYIQLVRSVKRYHGSDPVLSGLAASWSAMPDQDACTASTNAQWEQLFALPETLGMAFALHSPGYRMMSRRADVLNAVPGEGRRGQPGSIYLMGRRISGNPVYGAGLYRDRVLGLLRAMLQLPVEGGVSVPSADPQPATPAAPSQGRPGLELEHRQRRGSSGDGQDPSPARTPVRPRGSVPPPDHNTAREQWDAQPTARHHFGSSFANYLEMAPLFARRGVGDAAGYLATNMTELRFMGRRTPGHRGFVAPLAAAEAALASHQIDPPINSFWCLNVRKIAGRDALSFHSLGIAIDINPSGNPHILAASDFAVIHAVTGVDLKRTRDPSRLREASAQFSRDFTSQWAAAQTEPQVISALRHHGTLQRLQRYAERGFCTLDVALIQALLGAGLTWGGQWPNSKDFMHFELP